MIVIAIDAGASTGMTTARVDENGIVEILKIDQFVADWDTTVTYIRQQVDGFITRGEEVQLVAEQFDLRPHNRFVADLTPVKINATLEYLLSLSGTIEPIVWQTPGMAKKLVTDEVLKNLGWYVTGKDVGYKDANDAKDSLRHLVYYLVHNQENRWVVEGGWPRDE